VVAGIIGRNVSHFDLWGDTVNLAARLESSSQAGRIQVSEPMARRLAERYLCSSRGMVELKGKGATPAFFLERPLKDGERAGDVKAA
jgi:class 3 adenylate cyclase